MQLFPETHPATLHTVLTLCKNDFFCTVDKLLYAKRCKALYHRSQVVNKKCPANRSHPYCCPNEECKNCLNNENNNVHKEVKGSFSKFTNFSYRTDSLTLNGTEEQDKKKSNNNRLSFIGNDSDVKGLNLTLNSVSNVSEGE